jgi:hypothetical protein
LRAPDLRLMHARITRKQTSVDRGSSVFHDEIFDIVLVTNDTDNHIMKSKNSVSHRLRKNLTAQSISE